MPKLQQRKLICINSTEEEINNILKELIENNIENILALRGDIPSGEEEKEVFQQVQLVILKKLRG